MPRDLRESGSVALGLDDRGAARTAAGRRRCRADRSRRGAPGEHCAAALVARGLRVAVVERELVGGECSCWACIPSKSLLLPGEAVQGAREAGGSAQVDASAALAWRDFMVSGYSDAGQQRWLAERGIEPLRGTGRLAGIGVVDVGGVRHTAEHIVVATGSDPIVPPIPGLRELDGVWTNREVEMAQAVRRLDGEVALVEGAGHVLSRSLRRWARRWARSCAETRGGACRRALTTGRQCNCGRRCT